jgi:hypothetical protein
MREEEDWWDDLEKNHRRFKWIANVDKDDPCVNLRGHIVGPPRAVDQFSTEELCEMGVVGIFLKIRKDKEA